MFQRLRTILAITSIRLSIAYTLIFSLVAIVIVFYMTNSTMGLLRQQIAESINEEVVQLGEIYQREGLNGLMEQLQRSAAAPSANLYVVADPAGRILAGNVRDIESGVIDRLGWTQQPFEYTRFEEMGERRFVAIARIVRLPNGMRLLLGRDLGDSHRFHRVVIRSIALSIGVMVLLGILTWVLIGRRALKRLDLVSQSTSRIMAGDRSERLPVSGAGDEFDRLSARLNHMLDRIDRLDAGLRDVSDNIAHDLKTPLARLRNKAERALATAGSEAQYRRALEQMMADADQIIKTFNALLMISRVESGSSAATLSAQDFSEIANDVIDLYHPLAEDQGFAFTASVEPDIKVDANRELLAQAISNLIDNALKYGHASEGEAGIDISLTVKNDGEACFCIGDRGPGIPPSAYGKVVDRFTRLEQSRSKPGNGLGLSLVNAVAQMHGGTLEFSDNEPGLRACLCLPVRSSQK
jgi:signal transduction histidine kinase